LKCEGIFGRKCTLCAMGAQSAQNLFINPLKLRIKSRTSCIWSILVILLKFIKLIVILWTTTTWFSYYTLLLNSVFLEPPYIYMFVMFQWFEASQWQSRPVLSDQRRLCQPHLQGGENFRKIFIFQISKAVVNGSAMAASLFRAIMSFNFIRKFKTI